jgi:two-component system, sensor histidine kinase PdtaS
MSAREEILQRQLTAFANFTSRALKDGDIGPLLVDACVRARSGLNMTHAKLLEYIPERDRLLLRAGLGWKDGYVGVYEVAPDLDTPIGHAFALCEPVVIGDYADKGGYRYPSILEDHGCVASINVPVRTESGVFGVLEVDHVTPYDFHPDDVSFMTGLGNTIAQVIELKRSSKAMQTALEDKALLLREMNHRIKNNLGIVSSLLRLQAKRLPENVREEFQSAAMRISNLALVHDRLQLFTSALLEVDADVHFRELCEMLRSLLPPGVTLKTVCSGTIVGDNVEAITLITNELVTNAAKYAFAGRDTGMVEVGYRNEGAGWRLWVADDGNGLGNDAETQKSFGSQLVVMMATRLNAELATTSAKGTRVEVRMGV